MASDARDRMVSGALTLLARHGLQATSFSEVIELTGAPRGSIYHHFPQGKDQLVGEAIDLAGSRTVDQLQSRSGAAADEVVDTFIDAWRSLLVATDFGVGCAVLAVTVAADSAALLDRAAIVFRRWTATLASLLVAGGMDQDDAGSFAHLLIAACEGAVVLSRAERDLSPLEDVARELRELVSRRVSRSANATAR